MLELNMPFQHFVNNAGLVMSILVIGLVAVCVMCFLFSLCIALTNQVELSRGIRHARNADETDYIMDYLHISRII